MVLIGITGYDTTRLAGVVDGYPAQAAGMEAGDVIKSINGRKVHSYRDINWYLFTHPQKSLKVTWERTEEGGRDRALQHGAGACLFRGEQPVYDGGPV